MKIVRGQDGRAKARRRSGSALAMMAFYSAVLAGLSMALLTLSQSGARELRGSTEVMHAGYLTEAGISAAFFDIQRGNTGNLGSEEAPVAWSDGGYWVTRADVPVAGQPLPLIRLTSTGIEDRAGSRVEVTLRQKQQTIFRGAAFGDEFVHMDSNSRVDSYDSRNGTYASQATNGSGSKKHANEGGDVGSNGNVSLDSNSTCWGDAMPGPGGATTVLGNAVVTGTTAPAPNTMELPPIVVPSFPPRGAKTISSNLTLPSGDYNYSSLVINTGKTLTVTGPARIVVGSYQIKSNASLKINSAGGPVEVWVIDDFLVSSNTFMGSLTNSPLALRMNLLSDNVIDPEIVVDLDEIAFDSNAKMYGTIYAPNAALVIDSNFELFGSLVAHSVDLDSNCRIHFDEALLDAPGPAVITYQVLCWRTLPLDLD